MSDNEATTANRRLTIRVTNEELARIDALQEALQNRLKAKTGISVKVSQKTVVMDAIEALEKELAEYSRPR